MLALGCSQVEAEEERVVLALGCSRVEAEEEGVVLALGCFQVEQEECCPGEGFAEPGLRSAQPLQDPTELGCLLTGKSPEP